MMNADRNTGTPTSEPRPPLVLAAEDYERLSLLARAAARSMPDLASVLVAELDRADIVAQGRPTQAVGMGSEVTFRDEATGKVQTVTLVYPAEADIAQGRISILTPVGVALIGLRAGAAIAWTTPAGERRRLTVLQVRERQPA